MLVLLPLGERKLLVIRRSTSHGTREEERISSEHVQAKNQGWFIDQKRLMIFFEVSKVIIRRIM